MNQRTDVRGLERSVSIRTIGTKKEKREEEEEARASEYV